jgi:tRNA1Val (adenine37-N6)-methyltransferase
MANTWFRFKQFTIQQQHSAMKVTTDGCLFGAWVAQHLQARAHSPRILDIGTGTGLLALMLAQKIADAQITGVEIEKDAAMEAAQNVENAPFGSQINILQQDILHYEPDAPFDVIVSNPPFYEKQWSSPQAGRNLAHHAAGLTLQPLLAICQRLVKPAGQVALLLPYYRKQEALQLAEKAGLYATATTDLQQTPAHGYFRTMLWLQKKPTNGHTGQWAIKNEAGQYTPQFIELLKDYYLHL